MHTYYTVVTAHPGEEHHVAAYLRPSSAVQDIYRGLTWSAVIVRTDAFDGDEAETQAKLVAPALRAAFFDFVHIGWSKERAQIKARKISGATSYQGGARLVCRNTIKGVTDASQ